MGLYQSSLVGRSAEQSVLREGYARAAAGRTALALVGGEPGIGKTSLVREFLDHARSTGAAALVGGCYDLQVTPPFGPWSDLARVGGASQVVDMLLDLVQEAPGDRPVRSRSELFRRYADAFSHLAVRQPTVVVLEDLHWSDPDSLDLLRFLARTVDNIPLYLIATYRDDEVERGTPLYERLPMLIRETDATRLDLRRLTIDDTRELVVRRYRLPATDARRLVTYLHELAQGNPLFIHELLRALEADGSLKRPATPDREWRFTQAPQGHVPALIRQVIDRRLGRLGDHTRRALEVAAVIGGDIPLNLWRDTARLSTDDFNAMAKAALEAHVMEEREGQFRFAHALYRASLYRDLSLPDRQQLHRLVAEKLVEESAPDVETVARHFHQAGDARAAEWLIRAGDRARSVYAWLAAAERYEMALLSGSSGFTSERERGWLLYQTALLWRYADLTRANAYLEEALLSARISGDRTLEIGTRYHRGLFHNWTGELERGLSELRFATDAMETLTEDEYLRLNEVEYFGDRSRNEHRGTFVACLEVAGRFQEALRVGARDLDQASTGTTVWPTGVTSSAYADGFLGLGGIYAQMGDITRASRSFERARQAYRQIDHHHQIGWSYLDEMVSVVIPYRTDDIVLRRSIAEEGVRAWERSSETVPLAYPELARLPLLYLEGHWKEARTLAVDAREAGRGSEIASPVLASLAQRSEEDDLFWSLLHEMLPSGHLTEPGDAVYTSATHLQRLAFDLHMRRSELEQAAAWLLAHDRWMDWSGAVRGQSERWLLHALYATATGDRESALSLGYKALELAQVPRQPLALVAAYRIIGQLIADHDPQAALDHLEESLALARSCRVPYEIASTLVALANVQAAGGDHREASESRKRARDIAVMLDCNPLRQAVEVRAPSTPNFDAKRLILSPRETEVLRLVTEGLTDAEIAERLGVKRRTVTTHLTSVYNKLGVSSRASATRVAMESGLV